MEFDPDNKFKDSVLASSLALLTGRVIANMPSIFQHISRGPNHWLYILGQVKRTFDGDGFFNDSEQEQIRLLAGYVNIIGPTSGEYIHRINFNEIETGSAVVIDLPITQSLILNEPYATLTGSYYKTNALAGKRNHMIISGPTVGEADALLTNGFGIVMNEGLGYEQPRQVGKNVITEPPRIPVFKPALMYIPDQRWGAFSILSPQDAQKEMTEKKPVGSVILGSSLYFESKPEFLTSSDLLVEAIKACERSKYTRSTNDEMGFLVQTQVGLKYVFVRNSAQGSLQLRRGLVRCSPAVSVFNAASAVQAIFGPDFRMIALEESLARPRIISPESLDINFAGQVNYAYPVELAFGLPGRD